MPILFIMLNLWFQLCVFVIIWYSGEPSLLKISLCVSFPGCCRCEIPMQTFQGFRRRTIWIACSSNAFGERCDFLVPLYFSHFYVIHYVCKQQFYCLVFIKEIFLGSRFCLCLSLFLSLTLSLTLSVWLSLSVSVCFCLCLCLTVFLSKIILSFN